MRCDDGIDARRCMRRVEKMHSFGKESLVLLVTDQGMNVLLNYGDEDGLN